MRMSTTPEFLSALLSSKTEPFGGPFEVTSYGEIKPSYDAIRINLDTGRVEFLIHGGTHAEKAIAYMDAGLGLRRCGSLTIQLPAKAQAPLTVRTS